ncbi:hypothetical protein FRC03_006853 [Tulasnella sp. 419]|nr:hypothetical protein FRC03_006853 [Tulasnella sp. 419]
MIATVGGETGDHTTVLSTTLPLALSSFCHVETMAPSSSKTKGGEKKKPGRPQKQLHITGRAAVKLAAIHTVHHLTKTGSSTDPVQEHSDKPEFWKRRLAAIQTSNDSVDQKLSTQEYSS